MIIRLPPLLALLLLATNARAADPAAFAGVYGGKGEPRWAFNLRKMGPQQALQFSDLETGALRMLRPDGDDAFVAGPTLTEIEPPVIRIRFSENAVEVCPVGQACAGAPRIAIRAREIAFPAAGLTLHGTVWRPDGPEWPGPRPTMVLAQGSEDSDRAAIDPMPQVLAARGFIVLTYDKRGTGASPGSWEDAGIEDLAGDLSAAIDAVLKEPGIDPRRLGLLGFSEGGWLIAEAAIRREDIAFLVSQSGGAFTKGRSYLHKMQRRFEEEGLTGAALDAAMAKERKDIEASAARGLNGGPATGFDRRVGYDPGPAWGRIRAPLLWMGGAWDVLEDAPASAARIRELRRGINAADKVVVFERANHALFEAPSDKPSDWARMRGVSRSAPGLWRTLFDWLDERVGNQ